MNKKVSTLLTASLLMMGPVFGSNIFAQDTDISDAKDKTAYALMPTYWWNPSANSNNGDWDSKGTTPTYVGYNAANKSFFITDDENQRCLFYVNKVKDPMGSVVGYEFVSVEDSNVKLAIGGNSTFALGKETENNTETDANGLTHVTLEWMSNGTKYQIADDGELGFPCDIVAHNVSGDSNYAQLFALDEIPDAEASGELNKLFNEKGFNLKAKPALSNVEVSGNLFEGDGRIWQFTLTGTGHNVTNATENGETLTFPAGTYFFAERVLKDEYDGSAAIDADDIDWLNSTFIAVSSTDAGEATDADRKAGKGFKLTTVKGSDFLFDTNNPSEMQGTDIAVTNACFTVQTNHTGTYPFAISVEKFFYQPSKASMETAKQETAAIWLGVISYDEASQNVASIPATLDSTDPTKDEAIDFAEHLFGFSDSGVVDGISLLNEDKTPAVYTIKFVGGNEADEDLMDKYLTVGTDGSDFQWEAKGAAIYDETYPAFQYVITKAEKKAGSDKYTLVTFTNRETGANFTAELFTEEGSNRYSLAVTDTKLDDVIPYTVNRSTYAVEPQDQDANTNGDQGIKVDEDVIVELKKVTPDEYAGFLNVDNETIRTLAFARDKNVTSNKLYAAVEKVGSGSSAYYTLNEADEFATEVYDAAQWQLVKSEKPTTISRVFAYNNTTTKSVDFVSSGDKVSAYTYSLRYVADGSETDWFLQSASSSTLGDATKLVEVKNVEDAEDITNTALKFYIKQNVDGSVTLFNKYASDNTFSGSKVAPADKQASIDVEYKKVNNSYTYTYNSSTDRPYIYASKSEAMNIKTYLDPEHVEISWPAEEGHVTIASELGNYISLNDERDGISVNESEAVPFYLHVTDKDAVVPSFYISEGMGEGSTAASERMFLFNPVDSVDYYVTEKGDYDKTYMVRENVVKAIAKAGTLNEGRDTITIKVKGEADKMIAEEADNNNKNVWGGLNRFKFQIVETEDGDGLYYIRQTKAGDKDGVYNMETEPENFVTKYLYVINNKLAWGNKDLAEKFVIKTTEAPTANEAISATDVKVIALDGAVNVKNAAGKNVVVSTILGQIVANEVLTSDNATISVPAGIAIVSVDGEEAVKVSVK